MGADLLKFRKSNEPAGTPAAGATPQPAPVPEDSASDLRFDAAPPRPAGAPAQDSGLGVPPYRPAPAKDAPAMTRAPLPTSTPQSPTAPLATARPGATLAPRAGEAPAGDRRTLVVGRGISVQGTVQDAERLVVEGTVEASMIHASELAIMVGGVFKGEVEVEEAEIAGTIDGTLTARGSLIVRATGRVLGTARCRRLQVEDGGQITGRIEMITEPRADTSPRPAAEASL